MLQPTIELVVEKLREGLDGARFSDGTLLSASDEIRDITAIPDTRLPMVAFAVGSVQTEPYQAWQARHAIALPAAFRLRRAKGVNEQRRARWALDELQALMCRLRGLPVDEDGKLMPYSSATTALYDAGKLTELANWGGPFLISATLTSADAQYVTLALQFKIGIVASYDRRDEAPTASKVVLGMQVSDPSVTQETSPEWDSGALPTASDVSGMGRFNTDAPDLGSFPTTDPIGGENKQ